jgi:glycosyltransferase involved in cell wall biosynthesis
MRIGFDAKRAFLNKSGLGNYSRDIIRSICSQYPEHEYFLYTPEVSDALPGITGKRIRTCRPPNSLGRIGGAFWRTYQLAGRANRDRLTIYHGLSNELPVKINRTGIKTVVTIHDLIFMRYPEWYRMIDRNIYQNKFSYAAKTADRIISISQQTKKDLIDFFGIEESKISVIYQGCNQAFRVGLTNEEKQQIRARWNLPEEYLLYVGTIESRKNLLTLVKALHQKKLDIPLVVVGRPTSYMKEVRKYIREKTVKNVVFLNEVAVEDLPGIYQQARVFIYPSLFEGFGIPVLEALTSGVPVVTSKGGCFSEVGGNSSLYIDPEDPEELGSELTRLVSDSDLQKEMIRDGLEHSRQFSNEIIATQIMDLYKELNNG